MISRRFIVRLLFCLPLTALGCAQRVAAQEPGVGRSRRRDRRSANARGESEPFAGHPRLFIRPGELTKLREALQLDPVLARWNAALIERGETLLREEPIAPPRGEDEAILQKSRAARHRITDLAGLYLLNRDERFAKRAREEMLAAAAFRDWNPSHFLDTGEMTFAMAVGYDWLYDFLSPRERNAVARSIIDLGLTPALNDYRRDVKWTKLKTNWAMVCNGGVGVGALAVMDENAKVANRVLAEARPRLREAMENYAPDGGFPEGPGYWNYATTYATYFMAAAQTTLGHSFGLEESRGFAETGYFRIHTIGPTGKQFNFGDAIEKPGNAPQMFWLGTRFKRPPYVDHEEAFIFSPSIAGGSGKSTILRGGVRIPRENIDRELHIFHVLWHPSSGGAAIGGHAFNVPLSAHFRGTDVAAFRTSWNDPDALYVALKGGDNQAGHAHLDLGTFVLDALGQRFAVDLGPESYSNPGYFRAPQRQTYYRVSTPGHNTLTINGENQDPEARAPLVVYQSTPERSHAVVDLTDAYERGGGRARSILRGIALLGGSHILVQDDIRLGRAADVTWNFHTEAEIRLEGSQATLIQNGQTVRMEVLSPREARFETRELELLPGSKQPTKARKLLITIPRVREERLAVLITTGNHTEERIDLQPLSTWAGNR